MVNIWFKRTILWWKHDRIQWRTRWYASFCHSDQSWLFSNFYPSFFSWVSCQSILMILKHRKDSMNMSYNAGFSVYMEVSIGAFNQNWFRCSTKGPKHCCNTAILNSKFTDVFIVAHTAPLASTQSPAHVTGTFIYCYQRGLASWFVAIVYCIDCRIFLQQGPYFII